MQWQTETGEIYPIHRIEDQHLANIYYHVKYYTPHSRIVPYIRAEVKRRRFSKKFLKGAPYPFFDRIEKVWKKWPHKERRSVVV